MTERGKQLQALGLKAYHAHTDGAGGKYGAEALITALAAMLAAGPPAAKRRAKPEGPTLPFSPQAVHQTLKERVGHIVLTDSVAGPVFGRLGATLKSISGLEESDLDHLVSWIEAGGFGYCTTAPTFQMVANGIDKYIAWAREWDRRGRPPIRKGGSVVGPADGAGFDYGVFK